MDTRLRMLDLFAGRGGAHRAMALDAWQVTRVELDSRFPAEHRDVRAFQPRPFAYDLVWASPPCTEFSRESMPWCRTGKPPALDLVHEALRVIRDSCAPWWVLENVRGSLPWLRPLLGEPIAHLGPVWLWGEVPPGTVWPCNVGAYKERISGRRPDLRSEIPRSISAALVMSEGCVRAGASRRGLPERKAQRAALRHVLGIGPNMPLPLMMPLPRRVAHQVALPLEVA